MKRRTLLRAGPVLAFPALIGRAFANDAGVGEREVLIGQSAVLSGPLGVSLQGFNAGAKLVFDALNARGGVHGRQIRLLSLDDELKPDKALANYKALLAEHKVFAFFGGVGSGTIAAATPVLKESNAPLIGNYALADAVREKARGAAYFVRATYGREATKLVQHLAAIGITRIAVAHLDNPGGAEVRGLVKAAVQAEGKAADLAGAAAVKNDGSNAAEAARALAGANAQAVLMFLSGPPVPQLMKVIAESGTPPAFYGMSVVAGEQVAQALGDKLRGLAISQVVPYPWSDADAAAREYRALCEAAKVAVGYYSYEGYLNALVLAEGLRRAGRALSRSGLHAAMRGLRERIAGIDIDYTGGEPTGSRFVELVHVNAQGKFRR